jgi:iron-sulfur cluster assembly protein
MLTMTETAREAVRDMASGDASPDGSGLRIVAEPAGEGETALALAVAAEPEAGDAVVEEDGARVFLEPAAAALLDDQVLDAQVHGDHVHFSVEPQAGQGNGLGNGAG